MSCFAQPLLLFALTINWIFDILDTSENQYFFIRQYKHLSKLSLCHLVVVLNFNIFTADKILQIIIMKNNLFIFKRNTTLFSSKAVRSVSAIYRITSILKVETDIITNISLSLIGRARIFVIMSVEAFRTDVIVFISGIIMCFTSDWQINCTCELSTDLIFFVD